MTLKFVPRKNTEEGLEMDVRQVKVGGSAGQMVVAACGALYQEVSPGSWCDWCFDEVKILSDGPPIGVGQNWQIETRVATGEVSFSRLGDNDTGISAVAKFRVKMKLQLVDVINRRWRRLGEAEVERIPS